MPDPIGYGKSTYRSRGLRARAAALREAIRNRAGFNRDQGESGGVVQGGVSTDRELQNARKALIRQVRSNQGVPIFP